MDSMVNIVRNWRPSEKVWVGIDRGVQEQIEWWTRAFSMQREKYPEIAGFGFAPVSEVVALQGADMIATETYQYCQELLKDR